MKRVAGQLRLEMAQFRELEAFTQFGTDLDHAAQVTLDRGMRIREVLKQGAQEPVSLAEQVVIFYAVTHGYLDALPIADLGVKLKQLLRHMQIHHAGVMNSISNQREVTAEIEKGLQSALDAFKLVI